MYNCLLEAMASGWLSFYTRWKPMVDDSTDYAVFKLRESLKDIQCEEKKFITEITEIDKKIRSMQQQKRKTAELRPQLLRRRQKRMQHKELQSRMGIMQSQLDILESSNINKNMLETLQTSSMAMKKLGLAKDVENADKIIDEYEKGLMESEEIMQNLKLGYKHNAAEDDDDLMAELDMVLNDDEPGSGAGEMELANALDSVEITIPVSTNTTEEGQLIDVSEDRSVIDDQQRPLLLAA